VLQTGRWQQISKQRCPLMRDVAAKQLVETASFRALWLHRPRWCQALRQCGLGFLAQYQTAKTAGRVGERSCDGM